MICSAFRVWFSSLRISVILPFKDKSDISLAVDIVSSSKSLFVSDEDAHRIAQLLSKSVGDKWHPLHAVLLKLVGVTKY